MLVPATVCPKNLRPVKESCVGSGEWRGGGFGKMEHSGISAAACLTHWKTTLSKMSYTLKIEVKVKMLRSYISLQIHAYRHPNPNPSPNPEHCCTRELGNVIAIVLLDKERDGRHPSELDGIQVRLRVRKHVGLKVHERVSGVKWREWQECREEQSRSLVGRDDRWTVVVK